MTLDVLVNLLRTHRAALRSAAWAESPGPPPHFYLDAVDTQAAITILTRLQRTIANRDAAIQTDFF